MNTTRRVIIFGIVSGLIWSVIPGVLTELFQSGREAIEVTTAGLLTGIIISLVLKWPLKKFGKRTTLMMGLLSLPLGAFVFGLIFSVLHPSGGFNAGQHGFSDALQVAIEYAICSVISLFAIFLLPLAVLTTFALRRVIHTGSQSAN